MRRSNTRTTEQQLLPSHWAMLEELALSIAATSTTARENKDGYRDMKKRTIDLDPEIARERERCCRCVETLMPFITDPITQSMLVRVCNQIRSGTDKPKPPSFPNAGSEDEAQ